ncbi:MAG: type II secretion system protein GspG [Planctomycetes bacterium]|nr:type II secretion system protein GspG [Planctomycetota bacterium]
MTLVPRSRSKLPLVLIALLAVGLVVVLALGIWYVLHEERRVGQRRARPPVATHRPPSSALAAERSRKAVSPRDLLALGIGRYELRLGRLPGSLDDLVRQPLDLNDGEIWDGPYIHNESLLEDPWGRRYQYLAPGRHNPAGYDLWSLGADGREDTGDDIGNWSDLEADAPTDEAS